MIEQTPTPSTSRISGPSSLQILALGVVSILLAIGVAFALSSAPAVSPVSAVGPGPADADGFVGLAAATVPDGSGPGSDSNALGRGLGMPGGQGFHQITITAKNGSSLSLKTEDGWVRQITVESDTTITRAGIAIQVGDVNVGDTIAFRQTKNADGSFKIAEIRVIVPVVGGTVTAVSGNSLTLKLRNGSSKNVTLTDSTKYFLGPKATAKADAKVGSSVTAAGTVSGETFTALTVTIRPDAVAGEVTATTSDTITIKTRDGASVAVKVDAATTYRVAGKAAATLADVSVGMQISAQGIRASDTTFNAISVGAAPARGAAKGPSRGPGLRGPGGNGGPGAKIASPAPSTGTS